MTPDTPAVTPALTPTDLEQHRVALTGHCYRMLGSASEAEDAVQETLLRAWRNMASFEGRSSVRSWLYRIATNTCLDMLSGRQRRARPMDLSGVGDPHGTLPAALPASAWVEPVPDSLVLPPGGSPAEVAILRESVRLAFVAALQYLPPQQRAVLLLREVLSWEATEVATLLGTSVAAVNSALQRARSTLSAHQASPGGAPRDASSEQGTADPLPRHEAPSLREMAAARPLPEAQKSLLDRYVDAFERYDIDAFTKLLHEDAILSMPPYPLWLQGHRPIRDWLLGTGLGCRGSRLIPTMASGSPAFGQYRPSGPGGRHEAWALIVLEIEGERIAGMSSFLDTAALFPLFGLPATLPGEAP